MTAPRGAKCKLKTHSQPHARLDPPSCPGVCVQLVTHCSKPLPAPGPPQIFTLPLCWRALPMGIFSTPSIVLWAELEPPAPLPLLWAGSVPPCSRAGAQPPARSRAPFHLGQTLQGKTLLLASLQQISELILDPRLFVEAEIPSVSHPRVPAAAPAKGGAWKGAPEVGGSPRCPALPEPRC